MIFKKQFNNLFNYRFIEVSSQHQSKLCKQKAEPRLKSQLWFNLDCFNI